MLLALAFSVYDSNTRVSLSRYELHFSNLPPGFDGFTIAHLSDIHAGHFGENDVRLLDKLREAAPEIIVITGDLIDDTGQLPRVRTLCLRLLGIAPVYYVTGNHEWSSGEVYELFDALEALGVTVLRNEYVPLTRGGDSILLAGVDDVNGPYDMKTPEALMAELRAAEGDAFTLLLAHRPEFFPQYAGLGFDLVLSGHLHGGLVRLPFVGGLISPGRELFPKYDRGWFEQDGAQLVVSAGLAGVGRFPRVFNPFDVPIITLRCDS